LKYKRLIELIQLFRGTRKGGVVGRLATLYRSKTEPELKSNLHKIKPVGLEGWPIAAITGPQELHFLFPHILLKRVIFNCLLVRIIQMQLRIWRINQY